MTILLVDDDLYIRELYDEILKSEGFEVDSSSDGKEGYEKITKNDYDLILLDVMLPQLDGIGILTKLKQEKTSVSCPIVLITNLVHDPVVKNARELGAHSVLTKAELTPDQLIAKVNEIIKSPRSKSAHKSAQLSKAS